MYLKTLLRHSNVKAILFCLILLPVCFRLSAQTTGVAINTNGASADVSAILDLTNSTDNKGLLLPKVSALANISSPKQGLIAYLNNSGIYYYTGSAWLFLGSGSGSVTSVGLSMPSGFTVSNSPVTTSGTLTVSTTLNGLLYGNGSGFATATVTAPLTYSGGTLAITQASSTTNGYLSSTDWNTFNNKSAALNGTGYVKQSGATTSYLSQVPLTTDVSGILPVANGGTGVSTTSANFVFAGPSAAAGAPSFRALVAADLPSGSLNYIQNQIAVAQSAGFNINGNGTLNALTTGGGITNTNGTVSLNTGSSTSAVNIGGGGSGQTITVGGGVNNQTLNFGSTITAGTSTVNLGANSENLTTNILGSNVNINNNTNKATNINTGAGAIGAVNIGGSSSQNVNISTATTGGTLGLGSPSGSSATIIRSGTGGVGINVSNNQPTNINTGTSSGAVLIGTGTGNVTIGNSIGNLFLQRFTTTGSVLYSTGATGQMAATTAGTQGQVLSLNASNIPTWTTPTTGTVTGTGTPSAIAFWNGASQLAANNNLYWDNTNSRLGLGTTTPAGTFDLNGDFVQQQLLQSATPYTTAPVWDGTLETVTITTHGSQSSVLITAGMNFNINTSAYGEIGLIRDGVVLNTVNQTVFNSDGTLSMNWLDNPSAGSHTYTLKYFYNAGTFGVYNSWLQISEVKQ